MKLIASLPNAVKRNFFVERDGWDATIKVDYDTKRNPFPIRKISKTAKYIANRKMKVTKVEVLKTARGFHLRIWLDDEIGPYTALRIQSMLGDDPERQRFNRIRVRKKQNGWNVLFNAKYRGKTLAWKEDLDDEKSKVVGKFFWKKVMQETHDLSLTNAARILLKGK